MRINKIVIGIVLVGCFVGCSQKKNPEPMRYAIEVHKSADNTSCYITLNAFEHGLPEKAFPVFYHVNNMDVNDSVTAQKKLKVVPGEYSASATFPGKIDNKIMFQLEKGDSLNINIFMEDATDAPLP